MSGIDRLYLMDLFVRIIHLGTFSAAARDMGLPPSKVSKDIQELERQMGSVLLNRSTRSIGITRAGETYYAAAVDMLAAYEELTDNLKDIRDRLTGELRVAAPALWGNAVLTPLILAFKREHPDVSISANYSDSFVDLYRDNIHVAFRTIVPEKEPYLSKRICADDTVICARESYMRDRLLPRTPKDLEKLEFITFGQEINRYSKLAFKSRGRSETVTVSGSLSFSSMRSVFDAVMQGQGAASVPRYLARRDIEAGRLIELLPDHEIEQVDFHAFYTERRRDSRLVATFIDFVRQGVDEAALAA